MVRATGRPLERAELRKRKDHVSPCLHVPSDRKNVSDTPLSMHASLTFSHFWFALQSDPTFSSPVQPMRDPAHSPDLQSSGLPLFPCRCCPMSPQPQPQRHLAICRGTHHPLFYTSYLFCFPFCFHSLAEGGVTKFELVKINTYSPSHRSHYRKTK